VPRPAKSVWRRPGFQRLALAAAGVLPVPAHRVLARGLARSFAGDLAACRGERAGRRLEPDLVVLLEILDRFGWPDTTDLDPAVGRPEVEREARVLAPRRDRGVSVSALEVPGPAGPLPARLYVPAGAPARGPLLLYFHGGGWVFDSPATYAGVCRFIASQARVRVLSASYRLAPEHRFPAAPEDALATLEWTLAGTAGLGADRVGVGGDSAGGNLATVVARAKADDLAFQLLFYPVTDLSREHPSYATFADGPLLTADHMRRFRDRYLASEDDALDPRSSPLLADDLAGMPPTYLALAGFDPLHDEGAAYGARLRKAGVDTAVAPNPGQVHAFVELIRASRSARSALAHACRWLAASPPRK
jgi:acetyl esterase